ncbi:condensation domain protein [Mycobacterium ulcerans str. Harvey]|uniref:Condensation domain protein n=1 Tax=Mycobacterium ulcerans str. Harvey TaxID=1299332 RepID=A0ABN0QMM0_MYCUL|nr:condensation domain protein [Mycobacterium ulcerans str. Harvey]
MIPLARVWEEILGTPVTNADANFFNIGGHSLAALRAIMRLRERMGVTLQMRDFVRAGSLTALAALIEEKRGQAEPIDDAAITGPVPIDRTKPLPLSPVQANLWYLQQLVPTMAAYNIPEAVRIRGPVDAKRLRAAFAEVVACHEALRTVFPAREGQPVQVILPPGPVQLEHADLTDLPAVQREAAGQERIAKLAARSFDLFRDSPVRVLLVTLADDDHYLAWVLHHIVADGWSAAGLLPAEMSKAYAALDAGERLPTLDVQPVDYVEWAGRLLSTERRGELEDFWRDHLDGAPPEIELPRDFPARARQFPGRPRPDRPDRGRPPSRSRPGPPAQRDSLQRARGRVHGVDRFLRQAARHGCRGSDRRAQPPQRRAHDRQFRQHGRVALPVGGRSHVRRARGAYPRRDSYGGRPRRLVLPGSRQRGQTRTRRQPQSRLPGRRHALRR